jgi:hypothetical protein
MMSVQSACHRALGGGLPVLLLRDVNRSHLFRSIPQSKVIYGGPEMVGLAALTHGRAPAEKSIADARRSV